MKLLRYLAVWLAPLPALAASAAPSSLLGISAGKDGSSISVPLQIVVMLTLLTLLPAAIMSIGAANLFTRNLWPLMARDITPEKEAKTAKLVSLIVKFGALLFIVFLPTQYAIDLQLLGGVWILQIFPARWWPAWWRSRRCCS